MKRGASLGERLKAARRLFTRPERMHLIYDKEGTQVRPRDPAYVYDHIESLLAAHMEAYSTLIGALGSLLTCEALDAVPDEPRDDAEPYWNNGFFTAVDARVAYALTAARRPRRIVEIGSGNSTRFFRKAITDHGFDCRLTAIDPSPRAAIGGVADEVIAESVLDVDLGRFAALEANDILFVDGSHLALNGTDTTRIFLEVLPLIRQGVLVHVHDICLPFEYSALFTERMYAEQYLLACTLMDSAKWRPLLPVHYLDSKGFFAAVASEGAVNTSFWMIRT